MRALLVFFMVCLTGCSVLSPIPVPNVSHYSLMAPDVQTMNSVAHNATRNQKTLLILNMRSDPGYATNAMIYTKSDSPYQLQQYVLHAWLSDPATMIVPMLHRALSQKHHFQAVVVSPYAGVADVVLTTRLMSLKQEFNGDSSQEYGAIIATVMDANTHRVIDERSGRRPPRGPAVGEGK